MLGRDVQESKLSDIVLTFWGSTSLQCVSQNSTAINAKGSIIRVYAWAPLILPTDLGPQMMLLFLLTVLTLLWQSHPSKCPSQQWPNLTLEDLLEDRCSNCWP